MMLSMLSVTCALVLGADPKATPAAPSVSLPRSSIAAVLAHRNELGLDEAQVSQLEERDAALQKQVAELRQQLAATSSHRGGDWRGAEQPLPGPSAVGSAPLSPTAAALPEGSSGGGHRGGGTGRHGGSGRGAPATQDPAARAASLQSKIDDADTAAWLAAEAVLPEAKREQARDVAEKYREALADEREAARAGRAGK